ncbi:MAG: hypothetical protein ACRC37_01280, partial [Lentisphaeria bacterium]
ENKVWLDTAGYNLFVIENKHLLCSLWGMDKTPVLGLGKSSLPNWVTHLSLLSSGERYMYFNCRKNFLESNIFSLYDKTTLRWTKFELEESPIKTNSFGDTITFKVNDGNWLLCRNGLLKRIFLGIDSNILYLDNDKLIFNNDCRLYEFNLRTDVITKIAESDYIRYAEAVFFY